MAFHAGAFLNDRLYCHGGISQYQSTKPLSGLYEFSLLNGGHWKRLADGPALSHHAAVAVDDRYLLLVGGWTGHVRTSNVHLFDTLSGTWSHPADSGFPGGAGLSSHTVTAIGEYSSNTNLKNIEYTMYTRSLHTTC